MKNTQFKKRVHLKHFDYTGSYRYFITICTSEKKEIFVEEKVVNWMIEILKELSEKYGFMVWAYCFMPDHIHLLIEGKDSSSNMRKFISMFKQTSGYHYQNVTHVKLWQTNYYEHVLRRDEDLKEVAQYIFGNPLRRGMVKDYRDYPYSGSFEIGQHEM